MKIRRLVILALAGAGLYAMAASRREAKVSMHSLDWEGAGEGVPRRYRSPAHVLHHVLELAGLAAPITQVYVLRAISPAFREQIMIVTAMSNQCPP